jgi:glutathione S-transferase
MCEFSTRRAIAGPVRRPLAPPRAPSRRAADAILENLRFGSILVLKLIATLTSPYARKVRIALAEKKIEYVLVEDSPWVPGNAVSDLNPLGKIPVLVLDDGTRLFDSRVIVEYLDAMSPVSRLIPEPSRQRIAVKRWEALADGICDAASTIFLERKRPARQQSKDWIARQRAKIDRGVAELAEELGERAWCNGEGYSLADIATGCALDYLDLRFPEVDWRGAHPNLVTLAEKLAARTSFADSAPPRG